MGNNNTYFEITIMKDNELVGEVLVAKTKMAMEEAIKTIMKSDVEDIIIYVDELDGLTNLINTTRYKK